MSREEINKLIGASNEELNSYLAKEVEKLVEGLSGPSKARLEGIQWKINHLRRKYKNNQTKLMIELNMLMWESFAELKHQMRGLNNDSK